MSCQVRKRYTFLPAAYSWVYVAVARDIIMASTQGMKSFCVVTGASRGIGRAVAKVLSQKFADDSLIVLTGRSTADLEETKRLIQESSPGVLVKVVTADLSNKASLCAALGEITEGVDGSDFQQVTVINNAASFWDPSRFSGIGLIRP